MNSPSPILETTEPTPQAKGFRFRPFAKDGSFVSLAGTQQIRKLAVQGAGATSIAQGLGMGLQILSTLVLARMLTPSDFGIVTMVTTFSLLFMNAGGNGFTEAILQRKELPRSLANNIFWINFGTGLAFTLLFAAMGTGMAHFYGNPRVTRVALALSLTVILTSTSVVPLALLMRGLRFPVVYANQMFARFFSILVSVLFAWLGWGYWALVIGALAQPLSESIGAWTLCGWLPGLPRRVEGTGSIVVFALKVYGRFSFNYFARNVDNVLIGWRFNAQSLGLYKKAYDLFSFSAIIQSFTNVAVSALSRFADDANRYKKHLMSALSVWSFLGMGVGGVITLCGTDFIRILLGPRWEYAGQIFTYFGPGFGIMFIYGIHGWIHLSLGKPGRWFRWAVLEFVVTSLMFVIALRWGPAGVASAWSVSLAILVIPSLYYAGKPVALEISAIVAAVWKFVVASLVAGSASVLLIRHISSLARTTNFGEAIVRSTLLSLVFAAFYVLVVGALHGSWQPLRQVWDLAQEMLPSRKQGKTAVNPS
jgi:O-antigen/teichoic acid export membrane protein